MSKLPEPPKTYRNFISRYPKIGQAWDLITEAGQEGPLDEKALRLVKLGIAIGSMKEGAIHAAARKAVASGATAEEIGQVIALAASTIGLPSTVAIFSWVQEHLHASSASNS